MSGAVEVMFPRPQARQRYIKSHGEVWIDMPVGDFPRLRQAPGPVPGRPKYWREPLTWRDFISRIQFITLGGAAEGRYKLWRFNFSTYDDLRNLFKILPLYEGAKDEVDGLLNKMESSGQSLPSRDMLVESEHGGPTGYYVAKIVKMPPAALAFAIQLLGAQ